MFDNFNCRLLCKKPCEGVHYSFTGQAGAYSWDSMGCNQGGPVLSCPVPGLEYISKKRKLNKGEGCRSYAGCSGSGFFQVVRDQPYQTQRLCIMHFKFGSSEPGSRGKDIMNCFYSCACPEALLKQGYAILLMCVGFSVPQAVKANILLSS